VNDSVKVRLVILIIFVMIMTPWSYVNHEFETEENSILSSTRSNDPWTQNQPWGQFGGGPDRRHTPPAHASGAGAGNGTPENASTLGSILDPIKNWKLSTDPIGTTSLSTAVGDFSNSINSPGGFDEECGGSSLYPVIIQTSDI
jgi:hypothetical protein